MNIVQSPFLMDSNKYTPGSVTGLMLDKTHSINVEDIVLHWQPEMVKRFRCPQFQSNRAKQYRTPVQSHVKIITTVFFFFSEFNNSKVLAFFSPPNSLLCQQILEKLFQNPINTFSKFISLLFEVLILNKSQILMIL